MPRKAKSKRTIGQRAAFRVSKFFHMAAGVCGVWEETMARFGAGAAKLGDSAEILSGVASVTDRAQGVEKKAEKQAGKACDNVFGQDPEAAEASGNGADAQASQ